MIKIKLEQDNKDQDSLGLTQVSFSPLFSGLVSFMLQSVLLGDGYFYPYLILPDFLCWIFYPYLIRSFIFVLIV